MRNCLLLLILLGLSINCFSQISFEKGYFIKNNDQRVECLIKNIDWDNNPTKFTYKLSETDESETIGIELVKEFSVYESSKYIRCTVNIDRSSDVFKKLSTVKEPLFEKEKLFLEVMVEGTASLYSYKDSNLFRFFYQTDSSEIEQLIFKKYRADDKNTGQNDGFKQQLWNDLKCPAFTINKLENLNYRKKDLVKFFVSYNKCNSQDFINFEKKTKRDLLNLNIRPGLTMSSLYIYNLTRPTSFNRDFQTKIGLRFGVELEYILPYNKNKWSILVEPTYQAYQSEIRRATVDYQFIDLPLGLRHYFFINKNNKIFLNASLVINYAFNSAVFSDVNSDIKIVSKVNGAFGLGYKLMDKYLLELRYFTNRDVLFGYNNYKSDFKSFSLIFGYTLF